MHFFFSKVLLKFYIYIYIILFFFQFFWPKAFFFQIFNWLSIHLDIRGFSFRIFKFHLPHQMTSIFFDIGFDLGLGRFISG